jgi:hypothetical protein
MAIVDLPRERRAFLSDYAEDVWRCHGSDCPVQVEDIVKQLKLGPSYGDFGDAFDGLLEHRGGRFHIFCNITGDLYPEHPRVRFTLGHELGHYFIDEHRIPLANGLPPHPSFIDNPENNPAEDEANAFSAGLLMPTDAFRLELSRSSSGLQGILDVSSTLRVSVQSAALRYVALADSPCAIVMLRESGNPWWEVSESMENIGLGRIKVVRGRIPKDSATGLALSDSTKQLHRPHIMNSTAAEWFKSVFSGSTNDRFLRESAVRLGTHGVLTLLEAL